MAGFERIVLLGAFLVLASFVLAIVASVERSVGLTIAVGLVFLCGIAVVLWGAIVGLPQWWRLRRHGPPAPPLDLPAVPPSAYIYTGPHPQVHPRPPPSAPPLLTSSSRSRQSLASAKPAVTSAVTSPPTPNSGSLSETPLDYAVDYLDNGVKKRATFKTLEAARDFQQVTMSPLGLFPIPRADPPPPSLQQPVRSPITRTHEFVRVAEFLDQYRPSRRFDRELYFQIELAEALRGRFGREVVQTEVPIPGGGRVDIEVLGVGVELKIAGSTQATRDLPAQLKTYQDHYGPNLVAVVFDDVRDQTLLTSVRDDLRDMGVRMVVVRHQ